jgi:hypothetical protein
VEDMNIRGLSIGAILTLTCIFGVIEYAAK